MKLTEIQEILYQATIDGQRYGVLYHVTDQENIQSILENGLLPFSKLKVKNSNNVTYLGNNFWHNYSGRINSVYFFPTPEITIGYLKHFKDINTVKWQSTIANVISVLLPLDCDVEVDEINGFSEGFPNAVTLDKPVLNSRIHKIESLSDFANRFGLDFQEKVSPGIHMQLNYGGNL